MTVLETSADHAGRCSLSDDPRLSRYVVVERGPEGERRLRHTVTGAVLPFDADERRLRRALFLAGQESEALELRLRPDLSALAVTLIVSWECNLRCTHCSVLHRLVRREDRRPNLAKFERFLAGYRRLAPGLRRIGLTLLGGEPLLDAAIGLRAVEIVRAADLPSWCDITTNLAVELTAERLELLSRLDAIVVSLDGLRAAHNAQRRPYRARFDPFDRTWDNLRRLVAEGLADRLHVQGAIRDEHATLDHFQRFQKELMAIGVRWDRISFGTVHPRAGERGAERTFLESLRQPQLRLQACCKYRGGRSLLVGPDDGIYSDFYDFEPIGSLDDDPREILARYAELVRTMPALADPTCRSCPVIGYCWGGCTSARPAVGDRPSAHCGREALVERVRALAREGRLVAPAGGCGRAACE